MNTLLSVKDLQTQFFTRRGVVKAVNGVSYDLAEGSILGVVGESGSGKSVHALSLMRLVSEPQGRIVGGKVIFEGRDLLEINEEEMRHIRGNQICMVFQEPMTSFNPVLTVGSQIAEALELHQGMDRAAALGRATELLRTVGIPDAEIKRGDYPHEFSGGMLQRTMIAMAISCNPKLLIADEPTSALDVTTQAQILNLIRRLARERNISVIFITHNLGLVARYVDQVLVMYAGRVVEQAHVTQIYSTPRHPYTLGLLRSVPRLDESMKELLEPIPGSPPDPVALPEGCAFMPRCPYSTEICARKVPPLHTVGQGHSTACWVDLGQAC